MRGAAVAKDNQRDGNKAAYEERVLLCYAKHDGGASADQRPDEGDVTSSQRGRRCVVSRSMPKVNIVTGHGVTPNIGIGIGVTRGHPDQRIEDGGIDQESRARPRGQSWLKTEVKLLALDPGVGQEPSLKQEQRTEEIRLIVRRTARDRQSQSKPTSPREHPR